jgi:hypothetical protein
MKKLTLGLVLLAVILLGAAGVLLMKLAKRPQVNVSTDPESAEVRNASIRAAYSPSGDRSAGPNAVTDPTLLKEITTFFDELGTAFVEGDSAAIDRLYSAEAMVAFMESSGALKLSSKGLVEQLFARESFIEGIRLTMREDTEAEGFSAPELRRLERIGDGELLAYLIVNNTAYASEERVRWWLLRHPDGHWQAYDSEDLESPIRDSEWYAAFLGAAYELVPWEQELDQFTELAYAEDISIDAMRRASDALLAHQLPSGLETHVRMAYADALETEDYYEEALGHYDIAEKLSGGSAMVRKERGYCHWMLCNNELARDDLENFADAYGWDRFSMEAVADCHFQIGDRDRALKLAEEGLAEYPQNSYFLGILAASLPAERRGELAGKIATFDDREEAYEGILNYTYTLDDMEAFELARSMLEAEFTDSELLGQYELAELPD